MITVPAKPVRDSVKSAADLPENCINELYSCRYYRVGKITVSERFQFTMEAPFMLATVVSGDGIVNSQPVKKGDFFLIPNGIKSVELLGNMELIVSNV